MANDDVFERDIFGDLAAGEELLGIDPSPLIRFSESRREADVLSAKIQVGRMLAALRAVVHSPTDSLAQTPHLSEIQQEIVDAIRSAPTSLETIESIAAASPLKREPDSNFRAAVAELKRRGIIDKAQGKYVLLTSKTS